MLKISHGELETSKSQRPPLRRKLCSLPHLVGDCVLPFLDLAESTSSGNCWEMTWSKAPDLSTRSGIMLNGCKVSLSLHWIVQVLISGLFTKRPIVHGSLRLGVASWLRSWLRLGRCR